MKGKILVNGQVVGEVTEFKPCSLDLTGMKVHEINPAEMTDYSLSIERAEKIPMGAQIVLGLACYISHKQMDAMKAENASLRNIIENVSNIIELMPIVPVIVL
jgi:hypothetical protein